MSTDLEHSDGHAAGSRARPRVVTANTASVDGRLTLAPEVLLLAGDERWTAIAGSDDPYGWIRDLHDPDVFLEGSGSFVPRGAPPVHHQRHAAADVGGHFLPRDIVGVPGRRWFGVVDGRGRVALQYAEWPDPAWAGWHALVVTSQAAGAAHLAWLREQRIPYVVAGEGPVDLDRALAILHAELGVRTVVCTGGGGLGGALLRDGLVDEVDVEFLPAAIGGAGTPALFDAPPLGRGERPVPLRLLASDVLPDGRVRLRYAVRRPE